MADRLIAIGDIHGCSRALEALIEAIDPKQGDTIVTLGDYVDRGPDSAGVVDLLSDLVGRCRLVPLLGNHEIMMLQAASGSGKSMWMDCGGDATLASYGGRLSNVPQHHRVFFNNCVRHYETDEAIFVHANYDYDLALEDQFDDVLFWQHVSDELPPPHVSGKRVFVGHTPQMDGEIQFFDHVVLMDTFCFGGMWLSAHDIHSGQTWQANNHGKLREQASQ